MDTEKSYEIYKKMLKIRLVEEAIIKEYPLKEIRTPVHLYIGQEAIASGIAAHLNDNDYIISNHRSHGHCLAKGLSLDSFFKELYGKQGGAANGRGGSMHLVDMEKGIIGTSAIVGGGIPIGMGAAFKQQLDKQSGATVIYFGDGAVDEGVFWETLNFSALKKLPILFVMESNDYASQTPAKVRHSYTDIVPLVKGFGILTADVDGNDAEAVWRKSGALLEKVRVGSGPAFLFCKTYRWMGHVGIVDDTYSGYRPRAEVDVWLEKCPIIHMERYLHQVDGNNADRRIKSITSCLYEEIDSAIKGAKEAAYAVD